jgi:hypothetical protein
MVIWTAKVGHSGFKEHPASFDDQMRELIEHVFFWTTGQMPEFVISSWDGELTPGEKAIQHERYPDVPEYEADLQKPGT